MHIAEQLAGAAVAGLHLVRHEQQAPFLRQLGQPLDKGGLQRDDPAFALDGFKQDGAAGIRVQLLFHIGQVARLGIDKARGQGQEILVEYLLPGGGQGGQGAAVEAAFQGQDGGVLRPQMLGPVFAGHLDGAFVGLRAGVAEEHLLHPGALTEHGGQFGAGLCVVKVRGVLQSGGLFADCFLPHLVAGAENVYPDAAAQVDVFLAVLIGQHRPVPASQYHREPGIGGGYIGLVQLFNVVHNCLPG